MPQGERFRLDRLSEVELDQIRRFLEIKRGKRRPIILSPDELLALRARVLAAELRSDDAFYHSLVLSVIDENGNEVARVPVGST